LAAFDGFNLVLNQLFLVFATDASEPGWHLTETVLAIKVVVGVSAAAVGALAVTVVAKGKQSPAAAEWRDDNSSQEAPRPTCTAQHVMSRTKLRIPMHAHRRMPADGAGG
jgi:hypothetical protein